jgi:hypothetical protein
MSDEEKGRSWWYTVPGVITSLAAAVTAVVGLVVAIKQAGWFEPESRPAITTSSTSTPTEPPSAAVTSLTSSARQTVELPAMRDYKLSTATFTLLKAEVSPQTSEKAALQIRVRMMNHGKYPTNFWGSHFRLILNGVPMAPESGLNEIVPSESAKEGDVIFVVPRGTTAGNLEITYGDDRTQIPLALNPAE